jgi:hypothetical protein
MPANMLRSTKRMTEMPYTRILLVAIILGLAGCHGLYEPDGHGPSWIDRPASDLIDKLGKPDHTVRLPPPSLSTVFLYTAGAAPGYAICEHDYFVRGETVVGYSEHGTDPNCKRSAGNTQ